MAYIHMYMGSPTAGGTDGTQVSEGTSVTPITTGNLNASTNEEGSAIKLALRCETGYNSYGSTTITPTGTSAVKWALANDNSGSAGTFGTYGAALTVSTIIGTTNTIFWAKAKATSDETPSNDTTVDLVVNATIQAV